MLVLCTLATTVAEKCVYTCFYFTSASFSDGEFRRNGAACLHNMQLCLLVRCSLCLVLLTTSIPLFSVSNIVVYMSYMTIRYLFTCIFHVIYRVIHKSLREFRTRLRNNQDRHGKKEHINR